MEDLTQTSSDEEVGKQMEELELWVSEALGILVCWKYGLGTFKIVTQARIGTV
jgi:hypothetical protein